MQRHMVICGKEEKEKEREREREREKEKEKEVQVERSIYKVHWPGGA